VQAVEIPEQEHAFREEALAYLVSRYERAGELLTERQFNAFRDFVALWLDALDWRTDDGVRRYLQLAPSQRIERFERFKRQADSWDVTLEFPVRPDERQDEEKARWKREHEKTKKRLKRKAEAAHWEQVRQMLEAEHRMRTMPAWLRESFLFLGLGPTATLVDARKRYRELARKYHPDANGSTRQMAQLNDAWKKVEEFFLS
jgi:hypothetical protein